MLPLIIIEIKDALGAVSRLVWPEQCGACCNCACVNSGRAREASMRRAPSHHHTLHSEPQCEACRTCRLRCSAFKFSKIQPTSAKRLAAPSTATTTMLPSSALFTAHEWRKNARRGCHDLLEFICICQLVLCSTQMSTRGPLAKHAQNFNALR